MIPEVKDSILIFLGIIILSLTLGSKLNFFQRCQIFREGSEAEIQFYKNRSHATFHVLLLRYYLINN